VPFPPEREVDLLVHELEGIIEVGHIVLDEVELHEAAARAVVT
jgi:hypothetical protein